jgi:DNA-binding NarL/FixJ family response regulator
MSDRPGRSAPGSTGMDDLKRTVRVLICDDQWIVCQGLEAILSAEPGIEVIGVVSDGAEALEAVARLRPDVVLMDLRMPEMNGIEATRLIRERFSETKVLVLTTYGSDEWLLSAIRSGASGYLLKGTPREALIDAVKGTAMGRTHVDPEIAGRLFEQVAQAEWSPHDVPADGATVDGSHPLDLLSERELDVLRLLARGLSNTDIAGRLYLSEGTVRNYVSSILSKLGVSDRTQAAVLALRYGLVKLSDL